MMKLLPTVAVVMGIAALAAAVTARGQAYPIKPVRVVVPWPPGGSK